MLDLKELERKLDLALAQETVESFTNWLDEERSINYLHQYGLGTLISGEKILREKNVTEFIQTSFVIFKLPSVTFEVDSFTILAA